MTVTVRKTEYFYAAVRNRPGEAYRVLERLAAGGVNLLAFSASPTGEDEAQLTLFPDSSDRLAEIADDTGLVLAGPHHALHIAGKDSPGIISGLHRRLAEAGINVSACSGVAGGSGGFGYVMHVKDEEIDKAVEALK